MKTYPIGFSPCPNDTFIFDAMVHQQVPYQKLKFDPILEDVETLNQWALEGKLPITKLSYSTYLKVADQYNLLRTGSALGRGVGPLLITKDQIPDTIDIASYLEHAKIAIPGNNTTANLLMSIAYPNATNKKEVLFSEIEDKVLQGAFDCGLVIHESRFTYASKGLHCLQDLGLWWEQFSEVAIPLGGIAVKRDLPLNDKMHIEDLIAKSIAMSWEAYPTLSKFVTLHAQEMDEDVMRQHINLYVNEYSNALGILGEQAIQKLAQHAVKIGWMPRFNEFDIFI